MIDSQDKLPVLRLTVDGPLVGPARIPLADLADLAEGIQQAVRQIGSVIQTGSSRSAGRPEVGIEAATRLELVGLEEGSARLVLDFPADVARPFPDLDVGCLAIDSLVSGIEALSSHDALPVDWDDGVFRAVSSLGKTLDRGDVSTINLESRSRLSGTYTNTVSRRVKSRLERERPMEFVEVVGRLMMVDFNADKRRCRIEPPRGSAVECTYPLDLQSSLRELAHRFVQAEGYAEVQPDGKIRRLSILRLSPVTTPAGVVAEPAPRAIYALITEQAPPPFDTAQDFFDPSLWNGDEEVDAFLEWLGEHRDEAIL